MNTKGMIMFRAILPVVTPILAIITGAVVHGATPPVIEWDQTHPGNVPGIQVPVATRIAGCGDVSNSFVYVAGTVLTDEAVSRYGVVRYNVTPTNPDPKSTIWTINDDLTHRPLRAMDVFNYPCDSEGWDADVYLVGEVPDMSYNLKARVVALDKDLSVK
jgi:hypothetical protein